MANDSPPGDAVRSWLARLPADLVPFAPADFAPRVSRSAAEVYAISRALGCPDLFVVDVPDPHAGESMIAQIAELAAGRVLVLSPNPEAADRLTESLAGSQVVRALADDENPVRPSPIVARLTSIVLGSGKAEVMRREAAEVIALVEKRLAPAERLSAINCEIAELATMRDRLDSEIRARHDTSAIARKEAELAALRRRLAESDAAPAGRKAGLFAWLFGWRNAGPDPERLEKEIDVVAAEVAALTAGLEDAVRAEQVLRRAPLDARLAGLGAARDRLLDVEREHASALMRVKELDASDLDRQLLGERRVVVGTPRSLEADPVFIGAPPFALLILDRCEELTEGDFLRLCGLAARWVLVGEVRPAARGARGGINRDGEASRNGRPKKQAFVDGLAQLLDREPWALEVDRIVCRLLHPAVSTGRQALVQEPLLDRPEIELRFTSDGDPAVAEVVFPAGTSIADAKAFLFHQLGEVLLHPCGTLQWEESDGSIAARWLSAELADSALAWIDLEAGVREKVADCGGTAFTAAIEFDRSLNWDRERAEAWLAEHQRPQASGRFVTVTKVATPKRS